MRIYDVNLTGASGAEAARTQETQRTESAGSAGKSGASGSSGSDRVEFSSSLGNLSRIVASEGADRAARVQQLAALYQSGNYRPNSAATSRAMVGEALASAGAA